MTTHRHRSMGDGPMRAWTHPLRREDDPMRRRSADGGCVETRTCRCGAVQQVARNVRSSEYGEWVGGEYDDREEA